MSARVLEIDGQFLYIPGCMIISFDDVSTHTTVSIHWPVSVFSLCWQTLLDFGNCCLILGNANSMESTGSQAREGTSGGRFGKAERYP